MAKLPGNSSMIGSSVRKAGLEGVETVAQNLSDVLGLTPPSSSPNMINIAREYYSEKDISKRRKNLTIETVDAIITAYFEAEQDRLATTIQTVEKVAKESAEKATDLSEKFDDIKTKVTAFYESVGKPMEALEGFKASIGESIKLTEARKLWSSSARRARDAYIISWIFLVILLVGAPATAIVNSDQIFAFFHAIGDAVLVDLPVNASETAILIAAVSRLVLVTLPIALFIWLIRIVVRFNMRSLLLMDDARQRSTMLETYLHLVEQDATVKADRPLILEALFRRTPGHGPETIDPPNFADVLRIGMPAPK